MRVLEFGILAHLAISVSSLTVGRNSLVKPRAEPLPSASAPPSSAPTGDAWKTMQCSQVQGDWETEWEDANAEAAWNTTIAAWEEQKPGNMSLSLYFSTYLQGPSGMRCTDIGTENRCSQPVQCNDADIPAGALILNGFTGLHQLHASAFQAIGNVQAGASNDIGTFTSTFSPQPKDDGALIKNIIDSVTLVISIGASVVFNVALQQMENVIAKALITDAVAISVSSTGSFYKTNMKGAIEGLQAQNTIDSFLGQTMTAWKNIESDYLTSIFSANNTDTHTLYTMINNGAMGAVMDTIDLTHTSTDVEKILYGQMIPYAWSVSQDETRPFIWQSPDDCDENTQSVPQDSRLFVPDGQAVKINVCYKGKMHYLLNAKEIKGSGFRASTLPGGDHDTLDGTKWGGITIEDIVASSVDGWTNNNKQNGYPRPDSQAIVASFGGDDVPSVRTPGFFNLPVCENASVIADIMSNGDGNSPYWPCPNPDGYTSTGTNIHVSSGCIVINESKRCETWGGAYNVADQNTANSTAIIYAMFNGGNTLGQVRPDCKLEATWPRDYGDLDFTDNCLRDRSGEYSQCCSAATSTTDLVDNPYGPS
ncbi:uncharacterized protein N7479_010341 [Penicillium vulpinum]|uniref:Uncharacterized protein n=1 Tax=Penicillium vulpinum TaxID=29845 RepID=A0A1V6S8Y1_9EURO|nr:uncharacterized protein N7479_010341 [Penicillium vulpinum]KAJ5951928.1 hypothetical protein N7479_010341 [Penicillium vulpinum]OQE10230.1 hypothetical protein PENVUL_c004G08486 [Penicillium vulpinum]